MIEELIRYNIYECEIVKVYDEINLNSNLNKVIYIKLHPKISTDSIINILVHEMIYKYFILNKNLNVNYASDNQVITEKCFKICKTEFIENKCEEISLFCKSTSFFEEYYRAILDQHHAKYYHIKFKFN